MNMTRHTVKILSSIAVLLAIVIATGIYSHRTLLKSSSTLEDHIRRIELSTKNNDWNQAKQELSYIEDRWIKTQKSWSMLIDHIEIDNIDSTLSRMSKFIETQDTSSALAEAALLKQYVKHIPEKESFNLRNIL